MDEKREKSIFRLLPRNSHFTWFLVTFALKNKALTCFMFIPVICMGYPIYLEIALWLPLEEFKTLYHICKYPAYK